MDLFYNYYSSLTISEGRDDFRSSLLESVGESERGSRQRCEGAKVEFALARRIAACLVAGTRTDSLFLSTDVGALTN